MPLRVLTRATCFVLLLLAGCSVDAHPRGHHFKKDAGPDGGQGASDAGKDAGAKDAGAKDAGPKPGKDASMPMDDAGQPMIDAGMDAGMDSGPPPIPPYIVPPLSGGGLSVGTNYRLRHVVGSFGPTHTDTTKSQSSSTHYRLGNALIGPTK